MLEGLPDSPRPGTGNVTVSIRQLHPPSSRDTVPITGDLGGQVPSTGRHRGVIWNEFPSLCQGLPASPALCQDLPPSPPSAPNAEPPPREPGSRCISRRAQPGSAPRRPRARGWPGDAPPSPARRAVSPGSQLHCRALRHPAGFPPRSSRPGGGLPTWLTSRPELRGRRVALRRPQPPPARPPRLEQRRRLRRRRPLRPRSRPRGERSRRRLAPLPRPARAASPPPARGREGARARAGARGGRAGARRGGASAARGGGEAAECPPAGSRAPSGPLRCAGRGGGGALPLHR